VARWADVERFALALPETAEGSSRGLRVWQVKGKTFVWDRPLRPREIEALGEAAPDGPIIAAWVGDLGAKEAILADDPATYFTTSHFDNYRIVLARLERLGREELRELVIEAWLARAPKRLVKDFPPPEGENPSALED
jgi:hypothetical protein